MKKKAPKAKKRSKRPATKDLSARKAGAVRGGFDGGLQDKKILGDTSVGNTRFTFKF